VILLGEYFVVHGEPAVVLAIDRRATVTAEPRKDKKVWIKSKAMKCSGYFENDKFYSKKGDGHLIKKGLDPIYSVVKSDLNSLPENVGVSLEVDSPIPVAAGLGSSAAVAVASAAALNHLFDAGLNEKDVFQAAFDAEKIVHGNSSGVDPAISTYGVVLRYRKGENIQNLNVGTGLPLVVGNTGIERSTGEMVAHVGKLRNHYPSVVDKIIGAGGEIVARSIEALEKGDLETLGEMMNINHALLCAVGVSNEPIDKMVYAARKAGALGAKLTGGGGGGCIVALSKPEHIHDVSEAIKQAGGEAFVTKMTMEGVRIEK